MKPGGPLALTLHHNKLEAYYAVGMAILDAGLVCTASLPCPAEMGGSIHIHGTTSSIIDTVFVCRTSEPAEADWCTDSPKQLAAIVSDDLTALAATGRQATLGGTRCIVFGHLTRLAVRELRNGWNPTLPTAKKLAALADVVDTFGRAELGCASTAQAQP